MQIARNIFLSLICVLFIYPAYSQKLKSFSSDPELFYTQMRDFLKETDPNQADKIMDEFRAIWDFGSPDANAMENIYKNANKYLTERMREKEGSRFSGGYSPQTSALTPFQKAFIVETANKMLTKKMKAFPDFSNYLYALMNFTVTNQSQQSFKGFQSSIDKVLTKPNKYFASFIEICLDLFVENAIYSSVSTRWIASNNDYFFDFDSLPKIVFNGLDLKCYSKADSTIIYNTKGVLYPTEKVWVGEKGKVNWQRAGFDPEQVYAELSSYRIKLISSEYTADSVIYYYKGFFDSQLQGKLIEKLLANVDTSNASYPRFESYDDRLEINNFAKSVKYVGGFAMHGNKIIGKGSASQPAEITFNWKDDPFLIARSKSFVITKDRIASQETAVIFRLDSDSIYHPTLELKYNIASRELALLRIAEGVTQSPYFNSYHKIDMDFEGLYWKIDDPKIDMKTVSMGGESKAHFESSDYFTEDRFMMLKGMDPQHPLIRIKNLSVKYNTSELTFENVASAFGTSVAEIKPLLLQLASMGLLIYDITNNQIVVTDRLFHYINAKSKQVNAKTGQIDMRSSQEDYDVLEFNSIISGLPNATLSLLNWDLQLRGVSQIFLSDSQNVFIYPHEQEVVLKKNRGFTFGGKIRAGRCDFYGKEFEFDYKLFKIKLTNVDSLRFSVPIGGGETDEYGNPQLTLIKSVVEHVNGELFIDHPYNKSGIANFSEYPILKSTDDSYVYYDKRGKYPRSYTRDKFKFHLQPFEIDSIDNFSASGLAFKGTFSSGNIFPEFDETLKVQQDYSLGFIRDAPTEGYPTYGGKGQYFSKIKLSNQGLEGDGTLNYITSATKSNSFIFFPDSMNVKSQLFTIAEQHDGISFPHAEVAEVNIHWEPYRDKMFINHITEPISLYHAQSKLFGNLLLQPSGLTGNGMLDFPTAQMDSRLYSFQSLICTADTSAFKLKSTDPNSFALSTTNVNAKIDFSKRTGEFKSNGEATIMEFPVNKFICHMDRFTWNMDANSIEINSSATASAESTQSIAGSGSEFISTHPDQDSLRFKAESATYSLSDYTIYAKDVKFVNIADARITPGDGKITIRKNADIDPLDGATILANITTQYHTINNAHVKLLARKNYVASGDYTYVDEVGDKQLLHFNKITVDTTFQTFALGNVADTSGFTLSPYFEYSGEVKLTANNKLLNFNGYSRITHSCEKIGKYWFKFSSDINPMELYIPIDSVIYTHNRDKLYAGIIMNKDSSEVYAAFLSRLDNYSDIKILTARGFIYYAKGDNEYRISSKDKLKSTSLPGDYLALNVDKCTVYGEGKLDLGIDVGRMSMNTVGNVTYNTYNDSAVFDVLFSLDFMFYDMAWSMMEAEIASHPTLEPVVYSRATYEKGLGEIIGKEEADKLVSQLNLYGAFKKVPDELIHNLFFTDLKLKWEKTHSAYHSTPAIGIGGINKTQVNKFAHGYMEIVKKRTGDILNIYLEPDQNSWYFFSYQRGLMQVISSNEEFNKMVQAVKSDKRQLKAAKDLAAYQFILSTVKKKRDFADRMDSYQVKVKEKEDEIDNEPYIDDK